MSYLPVEMHDELEVAFLHPCRDPVQFYLQRPLRASYLPVSVSQLQASKVLCVPYCLVALECDIHVSVVCSLPESHYVLRPDTLIQEGDQYVGVSYASPSRASEGDGDGLIMQHVVKALTVVESDVSCLLLRWPIQCRSGKNCCRIRVPEEVACCSRPPCLLTLRPYRLLGWFAAVGAH